MNFENEIGVGEYIRDCDDYIAKVLNIETIDGKIYLRTDNVGAVWIEDIQRHSRNKIDVIHIGDYVNGERVKDFAEDEHSKWLILSTGKLVREDDILNFLSAEEFDECKYNF